jgi:hypothetical protein
MEHFSWDKKMKDIDSWKPTSYETLFLGYENERYRYLETNYLRNTIPGIQK